MDPFSWLVIGAIAFMGGHFWAVATVAKAEIEAETKRKAQEENQCPETTPNATGTARP